MSRKHSIEALIPHRRQMCLIDRIISLDAGSARCEVDIKPGGLFVDEAGCVPVWVGLEYMGQTAALIGGYQASQAVECGSAVDEKAGYLAACRQYRSYVCEFLPGVLTTRCVENGLLGDTMAQYICTIHDQQDQLLAEATLTVVRM